MTRQSVGLIGATSLVGWRLTSLLAAAGDKTFAFSRKAGFTDTESVVWRQLCITPDTATEVLDKWVCVAPIWVIPDLFPLLEAHGAKHIVALSSTSRFTKRGSSDPKEQEVARRLAQAEGVIQDWAAKCGVKLVVLRPTLIYGWGRDKNIAEIARFIRQFGFFPVLGKAEGLRQPIHADDVAAACLAALHSSMSDFQAYNISGGETITYLELVRRVFMAMGLSSRILTVPMWPFRVSVQVLQRVPRYRHWNVTMVERMNQDLTFDHSDAAANLAFRPRAFFPSQEDVAACPSRHTGGIDCKTTLLP